METTLDILENSAYAVICGPDLHGIYNNIHDAYNYFIWVLSDFSGVDLAKFPSLERVEDFPLAKDFDEFLYRSGLEGSSYGAELYILSENTHMGDKKRLLLGFNNDPDYKVGKPVLGTKSGFKWTITTDLCLHKMPILKTKCPYVFYIHDRPSSGFCNCNNIDVNYDEQSIMSLVPMGSKAINALLELAKSGKTDIFKIFRVEDLPRAKSHPHNRRLRHTFQYRNGHFASTYLPMIILGKYKNDIRILVIDVPSKEVISTWKDVKDTEKWVDSVIENSDKSQWVGIDKFSQYYYTQEMEDYHMSTPCHDI